MLEIYIISRGAPIEFAAGELKKYLRMMMPEGGDIAITFAPSAERGFRLGLMQDMGLDVSEVKNTELDDLIYIDTDSEVGVIAGDNPRAVLLAVYEYLRRCGCRWLFPGPDGEYVPTLSGLGAVKYRHAASCRYRGPCIEGATTQQIQLDTVDFLPKVGMNLYMSQFLVPKTFYDRYYDHLQNCLQSPEPVSESQVRAWKLQLEGEIAKRGLQFHDVGHGWTAAPFGVDVSTGWAIVDGKGLPEEVTRHLAEVNGKRGIFGSALSTQFCMSNAESRTIVADYIADYASRHSNVDYLHVWLADGHNNHCECDECVKMSVSDWYVMLLNDIDRALASRGLPTRIVFIAYTETTWAPERMTIDNPDRFTIMIAPITRSYTKTLTEGFDTELPPFVRNRISMPPTLDEYMMHFAKWRKSWGGAALAFEYHFWRHQCYDFSGQELARRIFDDAEAYKAATVDGMIACGSQRSYFPNGLAYYVFARKQYDISLSFDGILQDYYSHAYGEGWQAIRDYLRELGSAMGFAYLEREECLDHERPMYNPERAEMLRRVPEIVRRGKEAIRACYDPDIRLRTASARLLEYQGKYACLAADALAKKAVGQDQEAIDVFVKELRPYMSSIEPYICTEFEFFLSMRELVRMIGVPEVKWDVED